ncbi:MAG: multiheme c-type cytochrome [Polyangiales bacterium]
MAPQHARHRASIAAMAFALFAVACGARNGRPTAQHTNSTSDGCAPSSDAAADGALELALAVIPRARAPFTAPLADRTLFAYAPSNARSTDNRPLPQDTFTALDQCSVCHAAVFDQWNRSAHRFSSMDNAIYAPSFEVARRDRYIAGTRFCAGCHDPALLFGGDVDGSPIPRNHERASLGVGCVLCHSVERLHDRTGNGGYVMAREHISETFPERQSDGTFTGVAPHRARVMNDTVRSAELCGTCHKVALVEAVTRGPWLRGQDEYTPWSQSAYNGNDPNRYDPEVERRTCIDCHMPREQSALRDVSARDGRVRSHRFLGGHTAMAALNGDPDTLARQRAMLEGAVRIDVFRAPSVTTERVEPLPIEEVALRPGERATLDVVMVNERVGHSFPGGTADVADVWVELTVRDARDRVVLQSGVAGRDGSADEDAHRLRTRPIDERGAPAEMRDPHRYRAQAYDTTLPVRAARVVRFAGEIPANATAPLRVTARLLHRRITDPYWAFICRERERAGGERCPERPTTVVAQYDNAPPEGTARWRRFYDHGRALGEGQVQERVGEALPSLEIARNLHGSHAGPWTELARVAIRQSRTEDAWSLLARAEQIDPRSPVPNYLRAMASAEVWHFDDTIEPLLRVRAAMPRYPRAIEMLANAVGLAGQHEQALSLLFEGMRLDPERPLMLNLLAIELESLGAQQESQRAREAYERHRFHDGVPGLRARCKREVPNCQRESEAVHTHPMR